MGRSQRRTVMTSGGAHRVAVWAGVFTCGEGELQRRTHRRACSSLQGCARAPVHKSRGKEQRASREQPTAPTVPGHFRCAWGHLTNRLAEISPSDQQNAEHGVSTRSVHTTLWPFTPETLHSPRRSASVVRTDCAEHSAQTLRSDRPVGFISFNVINEAQTLSINPLTYNNYTCMLIYI